MADPTAPVTAIVVSWSDPAATRTAVDAVAAQTRPPAEVVVVDNHPGTPAAAALEGAPARVLAAPRNLGFAGGVELAAAQAGGEWLFLVNPDAVPAPDCLERLLEAGADPAVAIAGAQVLLPDGRVNAGDNPLHLAGFAWSGRYGEAPEAGPPRDTLTVSGAALLVRREAFEALGGFPPGFFLYLEDTDLCWRARLAGRRVVFCPGAVVHHDYAFEGGARKWFWLERNRLWCVLCNWELRTLAVLAPYLLAVELGVLALAVRGGWLSAKLRAYREVARALPALRARRVALAGMRAVGDDVVLAEVAVALDTPLLRSPLTRLGDPVTAWWRRLAVRWAARRRI